MKTVTKSELARRLKVSPAMITAYKKKGLPILENGRVNLKAALDWHRTFIVPERSGSFAARQRAKASEGIQAPGEKAQSASLNGSEPLPPAFGLGIAYFSERLRDPQHIEILTTLGIEGAGVAPDQARDLALLFAYVTPQFFEELLVDSLGEAYVQRFRRELEAWAKKHIRFAEEKDGETNGSN